MSNKKAYVRDSLYEINNTVTNARNMYLRGLPYHIPMAVAIRMQAFYLLLLLMNVKLDIVLTLTLWNIIIPVLYLIYTNTIKDILKIIKMALISIVPEQYVDPQVRENIMNQNIQASGITDTGHVQTDFTNNNNNTAIDLDEELQEDHQEELNYLEQDFIESTSQDGNMQSQVELRDVQINSREDMENELEYNDIFLDAYDEGDNK